MKEYQQTKSFKDKFHRESRKKNLNFNLVQNVHETGLCWKSLPSKSLVSGQDTSYPGYKLAYSE